MNINIETWFSTPVICVEVSPTIANKIQSDFFSKEARIKTLLTGRNWGDNITTSSGVVKDFVSEFGLVDLDKAFNEVVDTTVQAFKLGKKTFRRDSWVNYQTKYQYQNIHTHAGADISACYYVQATPEDGDFRIHAERDEIGEWNLTADKKPAQSVVYKPKTGLLLVFPAWLRHSVSANMTDNTRISIACNYKFES